MLTYLLCGVLATFPLLVTYPVFQGQLISPVVKVQIPDAYFELFEYFSDAPQGRIANLPQQTHWDWKYYEWGHLGSGFLWYGIEQPIMDRAFDYWSGENENYYWELSQAIYKKDATKFESVLQKYDVSYILFDKNVTAPTHPRSLYLPEIEEMLLDSQNFALDRSFGGIDVYTHKSPSQSFIKADSSIVQNFNDYLWTDHDQTFLDMGNYISGTDEELNTLEPRVYYPYRSLFSKRHVREREFEVIEDDNSISMTTTVPDLFYPEVLRQFQQGELDPEFALFDKSFTTTLSAVDSLRYDSLQGNDVVPEKVVGCEVYTPGKTFGSQVDDTQSVRIFSSNRAGCLSFIVPRLEHERGYLVSVESRNIQGRPAIFSVINQTGRHSEFETFLPTSNMWEKSYFVLPPLAEDGIDYLFYFSNKSIGSPVSINDIGRVRVYEIPYQQMVTTSFSVTGNEVSNGDSQDMSIVDIKHTIPPLYKVTMKDDSLEISDTELLILNQSFHGGWWAIDKSNRFPFFEKIDTHVKVNNWANGWKLPTSDVRHQSPDSLTTIYIVFWPQLFEASGVLLLIAGSIYVLKLRSIKK